jgi:hypothetical protein
LVGEVGEGLWVLLWIPPVTEASSGAVAKGLGEMWLRPARRGTISSRHIKYSSE